jgi:hypothetical protein
MGDVSGQKGTPTIATKVHSSPCQSHHEAYHSAPAGPPKAFRATGSAFSLLRQMEQDGESFTLIREIFLEGDLSGYYSLWYARAMQHGSTGFTGPLGCRRGAKMGSVPARATHAGLGRQPACRSPAWGDSAKRQVTGDRSQIITARRTAEKGKQTKVRTKSQRLAVQRLYG